MIPLKDIMYKMERKFEYKRETASYGVDERKMYIRHYQWGFEERRNFLKYYSDDPRG